MSMRSGREDKPVKTETDLEKGDLAEMMRLEDELHALEAQQGIEKKSAFQRFGEWYYGLRDKYDRKQRVKRRAYILVAILLGAVGTHHFYARHYIKGALYLAFCWTGIPMAFGLIDGLIALPIKPDEEGYIEI